MPKAIPGQACCAFLEEGEVERVWVPTNRSTVSVSGGVGRAHRNLEEWSHRTLFDAILFHRIYVLSCCAFPAPARAAPGFSAELLAPFCAGRLLRKMAGKEQDFPRKAIWLHCGTIPGGNLRAKHGEHSPKRPSDLLRRKRKGLPCEDVQAGAPANRFPSPPTILHRRWSDAHRNSGWPLHGRLFCKEVLLAEIRRHNFHHMTNVRRAPLGPRTHPISTKMPATGN